MLRKILIVDDNEINRRLLKKILSSDYELIEAVDGQQAMDRLHDCYESVSAVLLDLVMPVVDGFEVLSRMRADEQLSQIPVIVTTGNAEPGAEVRALSLGANDFIIKPYNPAVIRHRLGNTINLRETAAFANSVMRDKLTGLYSREAFFDKASELIAAKEPGYYVLSCFDIDNFKVINDQYGVGKGDEVLKHVAATTAAACSEANGICCRVMADNFAVLYPASYMGSERLESIRSVAAQPDGTMLPMTISVGRYVVNDKSLDISAMYDRASMAEASVKGRFDVHVAQYDESMRERILREQEIVNDMDAALASGQFEMWLQPQYNHATGALIGSEALVRWRHPNKGMISPGDFIPVFERNGFVYELDKCVWTQACARLRKWLDKGSAVLPVSVNISRYDLIRDDFFETITGLVTRYALPVELLRLEITESAFARSLKQIIGVVERLVDYGFTIEIDDFGSGYSSLNTLKDVPASILKLDMRFLEGEGNSRRGGNIVESVVRMAKWLGMPVIAEGVETRTQADYLKSIGCFYVQGYLYAKPMPVEEFERLAAGSAQESKMAALRTVEALDNNAFWDPNSMETLIFNSYVGSACIMEMYDDKVEILRANDKYAHAIGGDDMTLEQALAFSWTEHMDEKDRQRALRLFARAIESRDEITGELRLRGLTSGSDRIYLRVTARAIASIRDRFLLYCIVENRTAQREAEKREREVSGQLEAILHNVKSGVSAATLKDGAVEYVFVNDWYYGMFGYTKEQFERELPGKIIDLIHPDDLQSVYDAAQRTIDTGTPVVIEFRARRRDGSLMWVRCSGSACYFKGVPEPVQLAVSSDVTQEKESERRIIEASEQLRFLNEVARDILATDNAEEAIHGALGKLITYFDGQRAYVFEFDRANQMLHNTYEVCAPGALPQIDELQNVPFSSCTYWIKTFDNQDYVLINDVDELDDSRRDERELLESQSIRSLIAVPLHIGGVVVGMIGVDDPAQNRSHVDRIAALGDYLAIMLTRRDLTARIDSDSRTLSEMLSDMPGGFCRLRVQPDGGVRGIYVNHGLCGMLGYPDEELRRRYAEDVFWSVHPDDVSTIRDVMREIIASGETRATKCRILCKNGNYVWFTVFGRASKGAAGDTFINAYYADMSEQNRLEEQRRDLLENLPCGAGVYELKDGTLQATYLNQRYRELIDPTLERLGETEMLSVVHPDDRAHLMDTIHDTVSSGGSASCDVRILAEDGEYKPYCIGGKIITRDENHVIAYATFTPIAREAAVLREMFPVALETMMASSDDLLFVKDTSLRFICASRAFAQESGFQNEKELIGKTDADFVSAELAEHYRDIDMEIIQSGKPKLNYIERLPSKDGRPRYANTSKYLLHDSQGNVIGIYCVARDVTDMKRGSEAMRIHAEEYRAAIEGSGKLVYRYTVAERALDTTPGAAALFGHEQRIDNVPESLFERDAITPDDAKAMRAFFASIEQGEQAGEMTVRRTVSDGSRRWFHLRFNTIYDDEGKPASAIILLTDVTDERESEILGALDRERLIVAMRSAYPVAASLNLTQGSYHVLNGLALFPDEVKESGSIDDLLAACAEIIRPEDRGELARRFAPSRLIRDFTQGVLVERMELMCRQKDGRNHWIELAAYAIDNAYNEDVIGVTLIRNIDEQKSAEEKLHKALAFMGDELGKDRTYQRALDVHAPVGVIIVRPQDGSLLHISGTMLDDMGYTKEEFTEMQQNQLRGFVLEEDHGTAFRDMCRCGGPKYFEQEFRVRKRDGGVLWVYEKGSLITLDDGEEAYVVVLTDVTGRKELEERQRVNEEEMKRAMAQMGKMIMLYDVAARTLTLPAAYATKHGLSTMLANIPESVRARKFVDESHMDTFISFFERIQHGEKSGSAEVRIMSVDGTMRWERGEFITIFDRDGKPASAIIAVEDTTQQHQQDMENVKLRENERILRTVAAHSNRRIYRYDVAARTAFAEPTSAFGEETPIFGTDLPESMIRRGEVFPESIDGFRQFYHDIHSGKSEGFQRIHIRGLDGKPRWADIRYSIIEYKDGEPITAALSYEDITRDHEKELAYERYRQTIDEDDAMYRMLYFEADLTADTMEKLGGNIPGLAYPANGRPYGRLCQSAAKRLVALQERERVCSFFERERLLESYHEGARNLTADWPVTLPDGRGYWLRSQTQLIQDPYSKHIRAFTLFRDVTEGKLADMEVRKKAELDGLTGIYNKATTEALIRQRLSSGGGDPCTLLVMDVDNLKTINDTLGHAQGDRAIRLIADTLREQFRHTDVVGRIGGDEFIAFLYGAGNKTMMKKSMDEIMKRLSDIRIGQGDDTALCASVGVAFGKSGADTFEELYHRADRALYQVKRNGKRGYAFYTHELE